MDALQVSLACHCEGSEAIMLSVRSVAYRLRRRCAPRNGTLLQRFLRFCFSWRSWRLGGSNRFLIKLTALLIFTFATAQAAELTPPPGLLKLDGRPAPALQLSDMDGKSVNLAQLKGRWVLVHFWASWCGPCRREMPTLPKLIGAFPPERLTVLLVNTAESDDEVFSFLASVSPELGTFMDRDGQVTQRWQPRGLPSTFFVDPQGRLQYQALGGRDWGSKPFLDFVRGLTIPPVQK